MKAGTNAFKAKSAMPVASKWATIEHWQSYAGAAYVVPRAVADDGTGR
jgi:hypothetical protein